MGAEIRIISDYREFCGLKAEWNRLLEGSSASSVWLRHEWYDCWWQAFGGGAEMFVAALYREGKLCGALPLMIVPMRIKGIRQRALRFIENGITPRSSFLLPTEPAESLGLLWDEVFRQSARWDLAVLANFAQGNSGYDEWTAYLRKRGARYVELPERISPYLDLGAGWEAVSGSFGRNLRRNLNRAKAKMEKFELVECASSGDVRAALKQCYEISKISWKGQQGVDMGGNERRTKFYDLITEAAIANGWINIWLLKLGEKYAAFEYAFEAGGYVLPIAADYDPEFRQYSPGTVLRALVLERLCERGMSTYDFAGTIYDYKLYWTKKVRPHSQFWVFHSGLKSRLMYQLKARVLPALERMKAKRAPKEEAEADGDE